jgi:hypothetical protein
VDTGATVEWFGIVEAQFGEQRGAEAKKARDWSDEECDERSRRAIELNLGRTLVTGYHGPLWTEEQVRLLGTMTDEDLAVKIGRSPNAVRLRRTRFGIPTFRGRRKPGDRT